MWSIAKSGTLIAQKCVIRRCLIPGSQGSVLHLPPLQNREYSNNSVTKPKRGPYQNFGHRPSPEPKYKNWIYIVVTALFFGTIINWPALKEGLFPKVDAATQVAENHVEIVTSDESDDSGDSEAEDTKKKKKKEKVGFRDRKVIEAVSTEESWKV